MVDGHKHLKLDDLLIEGVEQKIYEHMHDAHDEADDTGE